MRKPAKPAAMETVTAEHARLAADATRTVNWKRWGPYLSERQWGTVREDYSADGSAWDYLPHEHARSRAYRWGEDGLLGIADRQCRLCFSIALWNGNDPILKERLFGLTNGQGNHGEDVKEAYFYVDSTPTHSWMEALYKYPQARFPYERLVEENARRGRGEREFEIEETGVFDDGRYFDVFARYAKASSDDILVTITVANRGPEAARVHVLPTLWFRNSWSWGCAHEGCGVRPRMELKDGVVVARYPGLGEYVLAADTAAGAGDPEFLFTENETNLPRLYGAAAPAPWFKDAFHDYVVGGRRDAVRHDGRGSKVAALYVLDVPAGGSVDVRLRLTAAGESRADPFGREFASTFARRRSEADEFYASVLPLSLGADERSVMRQAYAGLLWSKQFYHYIVHDWLDGDADQPPPPESRRSGRNSDWPHLYNRDVISMPDKWEYPWYAAWDLAFHMLPFSRLDPAFAKEQLLLFLREWYMHPNGQLPAYEWALGDVNPPVHAWAVWRVYKMTAKRGERDVAFLERAFLKLMLNFTWWVNRKDVQGKHVFAGGFLGLDNVGVFDRSRPLPGGGQLQQADGTAWMAYYALTMLAMSIELARKDRVYEDIASKFFEHFVAIADAMNALGGGGLWDEEDGFYYDCLHIEGKAEPLRVRSMVGLIPLVAAAAIDEATMSELPEFAKRVQWFLENRTDLEQHVTYLPTSEDGKRRLLAIPSKERLVRVLARMLDEDEFLSPYGIRSLSRVYAGKPFSVQCAGESFALAYEPAESRTGIFGGNSNWRGPIWFPVNWLLVEALERYHYFYGETLKVEFPTRSGRFVNLLDVATELRCRLASVLRRDAGGVRPALAPNPRFANDPHWRDLVLFHEYFHGDTGRGLGASHQTGWTSLIALCMESLAKRGAK